MVKTVYTDEVFAEMCALIAQGWSIKKICDMPDMPDHATFYRWIHADPVLCDRYARAKEDQADALAEQMLDIVDNPLVSEKIVYKADGGVEKIIGDAVDRSRLQLDARKWIAAKMKPKKYGERVLQENQSLDKDGKPADAKPTQIFINGVEAKNVTDK